MKFSPIGRDPHAIGDGTELLTAALQGLLTPQARFSALSGVQVGLMKRICVMWTREGGYRTLVDPAVEVTGGDPHYYYENCFSILGQRFPVARPAWAVISWTDVTHRQRTQARYAGLHARLVLHEIDHMDGILCSDRVSAGDQILTNAEYKQLVARDPSWAAMKSDLLRSDFDKLQRKIRRVLPSLQKEP